VQQQPLQAQQQASQNQPQQNQQLPAQSQVESNQRNDMQPKLFNAYVYDFLKRSGARETARVYLKEADIQGFIKNDNTNLINGGGNSGSDNDADLPNVEVPIKAPEGFLYEWWTVFWDIYSAKLNRPGSENARRYIEQQQQRNRIPRRVHEPLGQLPMLGGYSHMVGQNAPHPQVAHHQQGQLVRQPMQNGTLQLNVDANPNGDGIMMSPQQRVNPANLMKINNVSNPLLRGGRMPPGTIVNTINGRTMLLQQQPGQHAISQNVAAAQAAQVQNSQQQVQASANSVMMRDTQQPTVVGNVQHLAQQGQQQVSSSLKRNNVNVEGATQFTTTQQRQQPNQQQLAVGQNMTQNNLVLTTQLTPNDMQDTNLINQITNLNAPHDANAKIQTNVLGGQIINMNMVRPPGVNINYGSMVGSVPYATANVLLQNRPMRPAAIDKVMPNLLLNEQTEIEKFKQRGINLQNIQNIQNIHPIHLASLHNQLQRNQVAQQNQLHANQVAQAQAQQVAANNQHAAQQKARNDNNKGAKNNAKTTPTQQQAQPPNIGTQMSNAQVLQNQQNANTSGIMGSTDNTLNVELDEVVSFANNLDLQIDDLGVNFDSSAFGTGNPDCDLDQYINCDMFNDLGTGGPSSSSNGS
ncbi:12265_t:CDS:10, partial [Acaulospora morrowiae]